MAGTALLFCAALFFLAAVQEDEPGNWNLDNGASQRLGALVAVRSSQFEAGCLDPIPAAGMRLQIVLPSSLEDLSFDLTTGQVQTLHSLSEVRAAS